MGACDLLQHLLGADLSIAADGDRLTISPRALLNDDLRASIKAHKSDLLASLAKSAEVLTTEAEAAPPNPDRCCWPHSTAMNSAEIERFINRVTVFTSRAMGLDEAETLADRLVTCYRDGGERTVCYECRHFRPNRRQCGNCVLAGMPHELGDLAKMPQRSSGFTLAQGLAT